MTVILSSMYILCIFALRKKKRDLKLAQLILIIFTIICNEVVIDFVLSDEHKISILDNLVEENSEKEKTELEGESESEFINAYTSCLPDLSTVEPCALSRNISNIINPFLEIHSPPPELTNLTSK